MIAAGTAIWRQRAWVWGTALAFLGINLFGLLVYQVGYANRVATLRRDLKSEDANLAEQRAERLRLIDLLRQARLHRDRIWQLYDEHFSTRRRRLTGVTAEVRALATRAGLVPRALNYPEEQIQQYGLIKRSFIFNVDGTYTDLRKFINLLELSDSFLTLESAGLTEVTQRSAGRPGFAGVPQFGPGRAAMPPLPPAPSAAASSSAETLHISLTLSTLFSSQDQPKDDLAPLPGAAVPPGATSRERTAQ
jgi:hypothetical protein